MPAEGTPMTTQLETYIPLKDAARKYGVPVEALTRLVRDGIIRLTHTKKGDSVITVSTVAAAADVIRQEIRPEHYKHLQGKRVRLLEAGRRYDIEAVSLSGWVDRGYIYVHDRGFQRLELDTADVKYAVDVFKRAKELTGSSIKAGWVLKRILSKSSKPSELN
jgi:hypothetical protein